jgi:hypothetical protein
MFPGEWERLLRGSVIVQTKLVLISAPDKKQVFEPWVHIWVFDEQI